MRNKTSCNIYVGVDITRLFRVKLILFNAEFRFDESRLNWLRIGKDNGRFSIVLIFSSSFTSAELSCSLWESVVCSFVFISAPVPLRGIDGEWDGEVEGVERRVGIFCCSLWENFFRCDHDGEPGDMVLNIRHKSKYTCFGSSQDSFTDISRKIWHPSCSDSFFPSSSVTWKYKQYTYNTYICFCYYSAYGALNWLIFGKYISYHGILSIIK